MIKLYDHPLSGNCYKIRLFLAQAQIEFDTEVVDVFKGKNKSDEFIRINPAAKIPAIEDDGEILWESNAILFYLCEKYSPILLPYDLKGRAEAYKWMFFNKTSVDPFLAKARAILKELALLQKQGINSLKILENHLVNKSFFVENYSIVDIAYYPYIKLCSEGNISLDRFPSILEWITRVENTENFVSFS